MPLSDTYTISGLWQARGETAQEVVTRISRYFVSIKPTLPPDLKWWMATDEFHTSTFDPEIDDVRLREAVVRSKDPEDRKPALSMGFPTYIFLAAEDPCTKPACCAQLRVYAGAADFQCSYTFETDIFLPTERTRASSPTKRCERT